METLKTVSAWICSPSRFGPCSALGLAKDYPHLVNAAALKNPCKVGTLLLHSDVKSVRGLVGAVTASKMNDVTSELLLNVSIGRCRTIVVPLINDSRLSSTLADVMEVLQPSTAAQLLNLAAPEKMSILLRAPPSVLVAIVSKADSDKLLKVAQPLMAEQESLLESTLLPILQKVEHPERIAAVVNQTEPDLLFWLLHGCPPQPLVAVLNACAPEDFEPEGAVTLLLQELADHRGLVRKKVIPLIEKAEPHKMAKMVQGVKVEQLLEVLQRVPLEDLILLVVHTNAELIVRLFNGPLESTITTVAGVAAGALRNPRAASTVTQLTDNLSASLQQADKVIDDVKAHADKVVDEVRARTDKVGSVLKAQADKVVDDVDKNRRRGQRERGATDEQSYRFGDVTRGFLASQADEVHNITKIGAQARGEETNEYKFGDLTRGLVEKAKGGMKDIQKGMAEKPVFQSVAQAAVFQNVAQAASASASRVSGVLNSCSVARTVSTDNPSLSLEDGMPFSNQTSAKS